MVRLILCLSLLLLGLRLSAAEKCEQALDVDTILYADQIIAAIDNHPHSPQDLRIVIEKVFRKNEGSTFKITDYGKYSADERNYRVHERRLAEETAYKGILKYLEDNGLKSSHTKVMTRIRMITRSPYVNFWGTATMGVALISKGAIPVNLPDFFFRIKGEDMEVLLLHGLDSPEGQAILAKNKIKQEALRGYSFFNSYYSRIALTVLTYVLFMEIQELREENKLQTAAEAFEYLQKSFDEHFNVRNKIETKNDVLFKTTLENFKKKFGREPDYAEHRIMCLSVYGPGGCP